MSKIEESRTRTTAASEKKAATTSKTRLIVHITKSTRRISRLRIMLLTDLIPETAYGFNDRWSLRIILQLFPQPFHING